MSNALMKSAIPHFAPEMVVTLATEPIPSHGSEVDLPASRRLGPGVVLEVDARGRVRVHWTERDFDTWMEPDDLAALRPEDRLISVFRCSAAGHRLFERHKLVSSKGLQHNWIVELLPEDIVRTERSDRAAWTFNWFPMMQRMEVIHTIDLIPAEDADAEALTVAGIAVGLRAWPL